jgi:hypothetical protein
MICGSLSMIWRSFGLGLPCWLFSGLIVLLWGRPVVGFCVSGHGPWAISDLPLPVYLNNNLDNLICPTSACSTFDEIRRSTNVTLDEFYDTSGSRLRLYDAGPTDAAIGVIINKAIHVFAAPNCNDAPGVAAWADTDGDGRTDYGKVRMCAAFLGQPVTWQPFPSTSSTWNLSWQGVMAQEIGHTLGFDHPSVCLQNVKSIMGTTTGDSHHGHHLYKDDIDAYRIHYGLRSNDVGFKQSATAVDWANGSGPPGIMRLALSRFSACGTSPAPSMLASFPIDDIPHIIDVWRYDENGWANLGTPFLASSNYHTGTACQSRSNAAVAWLGGYDVTTGKQTVFLSPTVDGGSSWGFQIVASGANQTRNAGVSVSHDPVSGQYVVVWRDDIDRITSRVHASGAPVRQYMTSNGAPLRASDSVSIACGPVNPVGQDNCVIAWADIGWNRGLRWAHGRVDVTGGILQLVLGPVRGQGYVVFGIPSVSYWSTGEFPWALVFHQGGRTAYTLRKRAAAAAGWQDERSFSAGQKIVSPVTGSRAGPQSPGDDVIVQWVYALFNSSSAP